MASPHAAGVAALIMGAGVTQARRRRGDPARHGAQAQGQRAQTSGRVDDHYGAGIVDADAALKKAQDGRGAGELGLAAAIVAARARADAAARGRGREAWGCGFAAALIAGSSGLFFLPELLPQSWTHAHAVGAALSDGFARHARRRARPGNPLRSSAIVAARR